MVNIRFSLKAILIIGIFLRSISLQGQAFTQEMFADPPIRYWPRPLWFWNNTRVTAEGVAELMEAMHDRCGYGGFGVVPFGKNFRPEYLSDDYLKIYGFMLEKAKELGMKVSLYDEFGFPSGSVGAFAEGDDTPRFRNKYPDLTIQRLDKSEETISGPVIYEKKIPGGTFMGAVAMEISTLERRDISGLVSGGSLKWQVPPGRWRIMIFTCVIDGVPIADYLNPEAIHRFTEMVHDVYYDHFGEFFGNVIYGTFYDEPSMFHAQFRMWTPSFNDKFIDKYGFSPVLFYPAMWYDIGPETGSARNYLFGFRADLYASGFNRVVSEWSVAHGITATGHTAPEEALVPANSAGDLMKCFKFQEIPGIDKIGGSRPAERFYKIISSAAYNWDKKLVMSETYGAMPDYDKPGDLTWNQIDSIAIDQYTKGINMLIPHAVWYDNTKVTYKPELSHRNPLYADSLKSFTGFLARLNVMLQDEGRHVADIALIYPVSSLLSGHFFYGETGPANVDGPVDPSNGFYREAVKYIDYIDVANWLTNSAGKDFTFIHPEVLDDRCEVSKGRLKLQNRINPEEFRIVIVPSCRLISVSNMARLTEFYNSGGIVVFTTRLPFLSAEAGKDSLVKEMVKSIFPGRESDAGRIIKNDAGGKACFIPVPDGRNLREILGILSDDFDVTYPSLPSLQYIHKVTGGRNIYYFGNVGGSPAETHITLRGRLDLGLWDPHTGVIMDKIPTTYEKRPAGQYFTTVRISLKPYRSCFLVEK